MGRPPSALMGYAYQTATATAPGGAGRRPCAARFAVTPAGREELRV